MTYLEIINKCKHGYTGLIPNWEGYLDWNYSNNEIYFHHFDYTLTQKELEDKFNILNRIDLYYII